MVVRANARVRGGAGRDRRPSAAAAAAGRAHEHCRRARPHLVGVGVGVRPRLELMSLTSMLMLLLVLGLGQRARLRPGLRLRQRIRLGLGLRVEGLRSYQRVGRRRREVGSVGPGLPGWADARRARLALGEAGGRVAGPHDRWLLGARRGMARRRRPCAIRSDAPAERGGLAVAAWMRWRAGACYGHVVERRAGH